MSVFAPRMRRWELCLLALVVCLGSLEARCNAATFPVSKIQVRHFIPLNKSTTTLPKSDNVTAFISEKAATHAPVVNISPAALTIIVGLLTTTDNNTSTYSFTAGPPVVHPFLLRSTISPNAP